MAQAHILSILIHHPFGDSRSLGKQAFFCHFDVRGFGQVQFLHCECHAFHIGVLSAGRLEIHTHLPVPRIPSTCFGWPPEAFLNFFLNPSTLSNSHYQHILSTGFPARHDGRAVGDSPHDQAAGGSGIQKVGPVHCPPGRSWRQAGNVGAGGGRAGLQG
jgi:hypothetical protein